MGKIVTVVIILGLAYLLFWPVPISPQAWTPPPAPPTDQGLFALKQRLQAAEVLAAGQGNGPEGVAIGPDGAVYAGFDDGRVFRLGPDGTTIDVLADTGGRPLGMVMTDRGLVIADALKGLLRLEADGRLTVLSTGSDGVPFRFVDDVDVGPDGRLYFSDASHRFAPDVLMDDFFEHSGNGRLLRYDPVSGETETLLDGLYFANGIAVGPGGDYVLVNETGRYQITRYWLQGPRAGQSELFVDNLPGFPDNISWDGEGRFWLALYAPRDPILDRILPHPWVRKVLRRLPEAIHPAPAKHAWLMALDTDGQIVLSAQAKGEAVFAPITSVERRGEWLYLGSLSYPGMARVRIDAIR
ncbi:SMP-30/gluconolactonase/LRE family protein [Flagellatimonas centrodinii]|uniref:SMP-30/gluconolactonase/LRE family protein n=1 Tax=Flagellatimonas centrodinii TaxID=2806210 RepID=UPI001FF02FB8|nr:SMP-30/gluconolactonase/LRE family protein [Flagellatimonas centrodinii]ULQ45509.1 SMP-30/gluconolactonase/LRE family protein [Flagellatimonas centrodinii]